MEITCKSCGNDKSELDFPKGKKVCKSCIANTKKENKEIKESKENKITKGDVEREKEKVVKTDKMIKKSAVETPTPSPAKADYFDRKLNRKELKLANHFRKMMNGLSAEGKYQDKLLAFIGEISEFSRTYAESS